MCKAKRSVLALSMALILVLTAGCAGAPAASGTLTSVADDDLRSVYLEVVGLPDAALPSAVTTEQISAGDATGWQYLWEENAAPRVELQVYENGQKTDTVTVLTGSAGLNGTILFGASAADRGWTWGTDLQDGSGLQSHRYTYQDSGLSEPRRLAAGTTALEPDREIWLAALLYDLPADYAPTDIAALQQGGLDSVPLAAVLCVSFTAGEEA